jgi:DNA-binding response OmpR family regulator
MKTVLIIEDDYAMLRGLEDNFRAKGYQVKTAWDGEKGLSTAIVENPDLVILDIVLPKINGYEVCSLIREKKLDMPIIMVTGRDEESDVLLGLNMGADDYVIKPFSIKVLLARAEAFLRRRTDAEPVTYEFGNMSLDTTKNALLCEDREIELAPWEFKTLCLFLAEPGCVLGREEILRRVWGYCHFISARDVDHVVASLRDKIEPDPDNPVFLHTVGRAGYKFEMPKADGNSLNS